MKIRFAALLTLIALPVAASCMPPDRGADLAQSIGDADAVACDEQSHSLELAIESFRALNGRLPTDESELVGVFIVSEVRDFDVGANGTVIPSLTGRC
jgi:hypothetical protein